MNRLKSITLLGLTTLQLRDFSLKVLDLLCHYVNSEEYIKRQYDALQTSIYKLKEVQNSTLNSAKSQELALLDDEQNSLLIGIREHCKGRIALRRFCPKCAEACETILMQMHEYGRDLIYGTYEKQNVAIPSFLSRMRSGTLLQTVYDAEICHYLDTLKEVHMRFFDLYLEHLEFVKLPTPSLVEEKKRMHYRLECILLHIDNHLYDETARFDALENPLNRLITEVIQQA